VRDRTSSFNRTGEVRSRVVLGSTNEENNAHRWMITDERNYYANRRSYRFPLALLHKRIRFRSPLVTLAVDSHKLVHVTRFPLQLGWPVLQPRCQGGTRFPKADAILQRVLLEPCSRNDYHLQTLFTSVSLVKKNEFDRRK
jgi:hypothetical protein